MDQRVSFSSYLVSSPSVCNAAAQDFNHMNDVILMFTQSLEVFGLPKFPDFTKLSEEELEQVNESLSAIFKRIQHDIEYVKECKGRIKQLEEDKQKLQLKLTTLESQVTKHEKEAETVKEQLKTSIRKWESEKQRFQAEKEELLRINSQLQSQKTKFQSEIRRRENELTQIRNVSFKHKNS